MIGIQRYLILLWKPVYNLSMIMFCLFFNSRFLSLALVACNKSQTSNFKSCVRYLMLGPVCIVIVVPCGAWNAWGNGLLVVKIKVHLGTGCQVHHHALRVEHHFAFLMCVCYPRCCYYSAKLRRVNKLVVTCNIILSIILQ